MAGNVIDLVEKDGVYVATDDVGVKPTKPRVNGHNKERAVTHNPAADRRQFTAKHKPKNAPLMDFIDGAKEGLSLLELIIKRMV